jgi:hypothetical protein
MLISVDLGFTSNYAFSTMLFISRRFIYLFVVLFTRLSATHIRVI